MENALLIGLSNQIALQRKMNAIANNMANINTAGFKSDSVLFEEYLMPIARITPMTGKDRILSYVNTPGLFRNFSQGQTEQSGNELDVAISGDGWLVVQTPEGERYTRDGQLKLDTQGQLVTSDGFVVLGDSGPITIDVEETGIVIAEDGTISTSQGEKGQLRVVRFENNNSLHKEGDNRYSSNETPEVASEARIMQGMVEKSNVKPVSELTEMISTVRAYTTAAHMLEQAQELRRRAIEDLSGTQNA